MQPPLDKQPQCSYTQHQDIYPQINHLAHTLITSNKMDIALMLNFLTITDVNTNISVKNN